MNTPLSRSCTAFAGSRLLLTGTLLEVALAVKAATEQGTAESILTFDDASGTVIDLDLRGTGTDVINRLGRPSITQAAASDGQPVAVDAAPGSGRGRGRPRLGVIGREVTLLPRHWEWLAAQPGGASVVLRRLVEEARRNGGPARQARMAQERTYRFMTALAGDLPGFEEATRALFAGDAERFALRLTEWPADIRAHALRLAEL